MSQVSRRQFLGQVAGAAAAAALPKSGFAQNAAQAAPARRPNVLFIMSDDMRVELGCLGSIFHCQTPSMDKLGSEGVCFQHNFCQFPLCNPSRASMLTGHHATTTGVLGNRTAFRDVHPDYISLPQLFKNNGYVSFRAGKIFHGGIDDPKAWSIGGMAPEEPGAGAAGGRTLPAPPGVRANGQPPAGVLPPLRADMTQAQYSDRIVVLDGNGEGHPDYKVADRVIKFMADNKDTPWFIGCGFVKPHSPPSAPQKFIDMYPRDAITLTPDFAHWPTVPPGFPRAAIRPRNADLFIGREASEDEAKRVIGGYLASISWVDFNIGRVLAALDRLGLRDNTIVVFNVDHGYQLGEKGKWSKAGSLFEMGTQVPLMVHAPGMAGNGTNCTRLMESVNIYPTIAELAGLTLPAGIEGKSFTSLLRDPKSEWNRPAFSVWSEDGRTLHGTAVRIEGWRYAEFGMNGEHGAMLFDREKDPMEMTNLAYDPKHADVVAHLSPMVRRYAANLGKNQLENPDLA